MKRIGIVVAVVVALVAATLAGVWLGTRNGTTTSTTTSTTASSTTPTPTTSRAGEIPIGTVTAGEGGTLPGPGALKLGYAHTSDGAVAALTNYLIAADDKTNLTDPAYRAALVNAIAADEPSKAGIAKNVDFAAKNCSKAGICELDPRRGAYAVIAFSDARAEIAVWLAYRWADPAPGYQALTAWGISTYALVWSRGDWKVTSLGGDLVPSDNTVDLAFPADLEGNPSRAEKQAILTAPRGGSARLWELTWMEYANALH